MAAVRVGIFFLDAKRNKNGRGPLHPENSAAPSGVVCCSGVLPPPVSGGKKRGREGARSDVSPLDEERCVVGVCVGAEKGGECALTGGSPLDGEWCVVGGCVGVEKGKGECAVRCESA